MPHAVGADAPMGDFGMGRFALGPIARGPASSGALDPGASPSELEETHVSLSMDAGTSADEAAHT
eukprot:9473586-Pyramimonas_sp.AAC.1